MAKTYIYPVILSGGVGTRLWPLSREKMPKQLLALTDDKTLLQKTVQRISGQPEFAAPIIICNEEHRFAIAEQMRAIGITPHAIILEPEGRNTAPAAAIAAQYLLREEENPLMLLLPADHFISDVKGFQQDVRLAAAAALEGKLVTFGLKPTSPETGYGYIEMGKPLKSHSGVNSIKAFVEKPNKATAAKYVKSGNYLWNSGMFLFSARGYLDELDRLQPGISQGAVAVLSQSRDDLDFLRLPADAFANLPSISIDYAVMEHTSHGAIVPGRFDWRDLGAWDALWEMEAKDNEKNALLGNVIALDTKGSYIRSEGMLTAVLGLENVMVITTEDAILVAHRDKAQAVKDLVAEMKRRDLPEATTHRVVYRPWGMYEGLYTGNRFQVKRLVVKPGGKLSLQKHHHRAEHWVVVKGTAQVTRGNEQITAQENESIYIPIGMVHRVENPGKIPLTLIEVQSGSYLGEDDIVRLEDTYGRK